MAYATWADVYFSLNIKSDDVRMHKVVLQNNDMLMRRKEVIVCTLAEASDLVEFERDSKQHKKHARAMYQAVTWGESGHVPDQYDIKDLHAMLFPEGGHYRTCDVYIKGSNHQLPRAADVPVLMHEFIKDCCWWLCANQDAYIKLAHLHIQFERLHGFSDGNGRVGRLLLNAHAAYLGLPFIKIDVQARDTYIQCLEDNDEKRLAKLFKTCSV